METTEFCFICDHPMRRSRRGVYRSCTECGHQRLNDFDRSGVVDNENLVAEPMDHTTALDRFKNNVLDFVRQEAGAKMLLDLGSGSGKFLYQNRGKFESVVGVEVSEASVEFASEQLDLVIRYDTSHVPDGLSVVTAWHSLEHIPAEQLATILDDIFQRMDKDGVLVVSVPNASSLQYSLFGEMFAFHDVPNHLHQFTRRSLVSLMQRHGFEYTRSFFSTPYNLFGLVQGFTNVVTRSKNYLYYRLKRNHGSRHRGREMFHMAVAAAFLPLSVAMLVLEAVWSGKQGVFTYCFKKH